MGGKERRKEDDSGLSSLLAGYGSSDDSDSESDEQDANKTNLNSFTAANTQTDFSNDATSKNDTSTDNKIEPVEGEVCTLNETVATTMTQKKETSFRPCRFFFRNGSCRHGEKCRFSHEADADRSRLQHYNQHRVQLSRFSSPAGSNGSRKRKRGGHTSSDSLLRKLLTNDMERESTLTMQLLKFVVDNNFFLDSNPKEKGGKIAASVKVEENSNTARTL